MNVSQIKAAIAAKTGVSFETLPFVRDTKHSIEGDANSPEVPTEWLSVWNNDARLRISAHQDVIVAMKKSQFDGIQLGDLETKPEQKAADGTVKVAAYRKLYIVNRKSVEVEF